METITRCDWCGVVRRWEIHALAPLRRDFWGQTPAADEVYVCSAACGTMLANYLIQRHQ